MRIPGHPSLARLSCLRHHLWVRQRAGYLSVHHDLPGKLPQPFQRFGAEQQLERGRQRQREHVVYALEYGRGRQLDGQAQ